MGFNGPKPENSDLIARQNAFAGDTDIVLYVYYYVDIYVFVTHGDFLKAAFYKNFRLMEYVVK